jgi:acetyl/propionyl-CoA carboxylase alpha subunit
MGSYFDKVFIPNRGVIAVRAIRTLRDLGIRVAVGYSDCDRHSLAVRMADEAYRLGPSPARTSYLNGERILQVALDAGCDALFPGYGFLAEDAEFAAACEDVGITFIGPPAKVIRQLGRKDTARRALADAGFAVLPGTGEVSGAAHVRAFGERVGYPLLLKPVSGAGGLGTVRVNGPDEIAARLEHSRALAAIAFGCDAVCAEKLIEHAAAISVQFLVDRLGNAVHLGEREGSIQREYGKLIDEAPSPKVDPVTRARLGSQVAQAMAAMGYVTAGTVEFLLDPDGEIYAIEANPRIQVEHVVTEMVVGVDILREMIRTAAGEPLLWTQDDVAFQRHAIQCRVRAEDPRTGFAPSSGRISYLHESSEPDVRHDDGIFQGCAVPMYYDSLLLKVCAVGEDRPSAIRRLAASLAELQIQGVKTTVPLQRRILEHPEFVAGSYDTGFLQQHLSELLGGPGARCGAFDRRSRAVAAGPASATDGLFYR